MPLILHDKKDKFSFAVWQITEDLSFFTERIKLCKKEQNEVNHFNEKRLLEWIVSRFLLSLLENRKHRSCCLKDKNGKPYLQNSNKTISLSHSRDFVAACISNCNIGIDIQIASDKIKRIKYKFLSEFELDICKEDDICLNRFWTAKEALYKAYGHKGLNFMNNIFLSPFVKEGKELKSLGRILKNNLEFNYELFSMDIEKSILTIAIENKKNEKQNTFISFSS